MESMTCRRPYQQVAGRNGVLPSVAGALGTRRKSDVMRLETLAGVRT